MGAEQLALLPAALADVPPEIPLADLLRDMRADPRRLPLWAEMAGEAWFARAWTTCLRWDVLERLAGWFFGTWIVQDPHDLPHPEHIGLDRDLNHVDPPDCAACADRVRSYRGTVTLAMLREVLARKAAP